MRRSLMKKKGNALKTFDEKRKLTVFSLSLGSLYVYLSSSRETPPVFAFYINFFCSCFLSSFSCLSLSLRVKGRKQRTAKEERQTGRGDRRIEDSFFLFFELMSSPCTLGSFESFACSGKQFFLQLFFFLFSCRSSTNYSFSLHPSPFLI